MNCPKMDNWSVISSKTGFKLYMLYTSKFELHCHQKCLHLPSCMALSNLFSCPGFTKTSYRVSCKANEDFGVLRLGEKALDSHLPNSLSAAFRVLRHQLDHGQSITRDDIPTRPQESQDNCCEANPLERVLLTPATAQAPLTENPPQGAHATYGGLHRHSRTTGSYELTQHVDAQQRQGGGLPVLAEVPEHSNGGSATLVSYV